MKLTGGPVTVSTITFASIIYRNAARELSARAIELDDPASVQLTGRCDRLQEPTAWRRNWKKALWLALGISIPLIIFGLVIWLIIHRGPAH